MLFSLKDYSCYQVENGLLTNSFENFSAIIKGPGLYYLNIGTDRSSLLFSSLSTRNQYYKGSYEILNEDGIVDPSIVPLHLSKDVTFPQNITLKNYLSFLASDMSDSSYAERLTLYLETFALKERMNIKLSKLTENEQSALIVAPLYFQTHPIYLLELNHLRFNENVLSKIFEFVTTWKKDSLIIIDSIEFDSLKELAIHLTNNYEDKKEKNVITLTNQSPQLPKFTFKKLFHFGKSHSIIYSLFLIFTFLTPLSVLFLNSFNTPLNSNLSYISFSASDNKKITPETIHNFGITKDTLPLHYKDLDKMNPKLIGVPMVSFKVYPLTDFTKQYYSIKSSEKKTYYYSQDIDSAIINPSNSVCPMYSNSMMTYSIPLSYDCCQKNIGILDSKYEKTILINEKEYLKLVSEYYFAKNYILRDTSTKKNKYAYLSLLVGAPLETISSNTPSFQTKNSFEFYNLKEKSSYKIKEITPTTGYPLDNEVIIPQDLMIKITKESSSEVYTVVATSETEHQEILKKLRSHAVHIDDSRAFVNQQNSDKNYKFVGQSLAIVLSTLIILIVCGYLFVFKYKPSKMESLIDKNHIRSRLTVLSIMSFITTVLNIPFYFIFGFNIISLTISLVFVLIPLTINTTLFIRGKHYVKTN